MPFSRDWATPLTIGAFLLMAVTGVLMFFHLDIGLNKAAHEWLGWAMVAGVVCHSIANWPAFKRHLGRRTGLVIIGVFALLLAGSFAVQPPQQGGNPAVRAGKAVLNAPVRTVAALSNQTPEALIATLRSAGFQVESAEQTLISVTGPERDPQFKALGLAFR